jgi:hypothetical protein
MAGGTNEQAQMAEVVPIALIDETLYRYERQARGLVLLAAVGKRCREQVGAEVLEPNPDPPLAEPAAAIRLELVDPASAETVATVVLLIDGGLDAGEVEPLRRSRRRPVLSMTSPGYFVTISVHLDDPQRQTNLDVRAPIGAQPPPRPMRKPPKPLSIAAQRGTG